MSSYRRNFQNGGTYFFTVNLQDRRKALLTQHIELLRSVVAKVKRTQPFSIDAWVVLPDHIHAMWTLPIGDANYPNRWREIKKQFSKNLGTDDQFPHEGLNKDKRGIWQPRFWEHTIEDERDYRNHFDYIHFNPVKHGLVSNARDWPFSTFHREVTKGTYSHNWCSDPDRIDCPSYGEADE